MLELDSPGAAVKWLRSHASGDLRVDSRQILAGDAFIAWPGTTTDGRRYVPEALARGSHACLVERAGVEVFGFSSDAIACFGGLRSATGPIASEWYGAPTDRIDVLAVTGTNGKTSTVWWLAQAMSGLPEGEGVPTGMIGTLGIGIPPAPGAAPLTDIGLTTPDPVTAQRWFRRFADDDLAACAIEASSIGLAEHRLDGSRIRVAIFTNFSQDHLDYHGSLTAYWQAKSRLFDWPGLRAAVINIDDAHGAALARRLDNAAVDVWTVSCAQSARLVADSVDIDSDGLRFTVTEGGECHALSASLLGSYNVMNLLGVIGAMRAMGVSLVSAVCACHSLKPVPGRLQRLGGHGQPLVVVDYAHTQDALEKVLGDLLPLARKRQGQLWCVFGCGGDRDRTKRGSMAAAVERNADRIVVTSDNPRSEKPDAIIDQIVKGFGRPERARVQPERARAIADAIAGAATSDVICVAGKGHETYQEIEGVRLPFSDVEHATNALALRTIRGREVGARMLP